MTARVASSRLIGRSAELAELEAALADAADGRPSTVFVAGESGVGKTRLLQELQDRARAAGTLVLAGDCVDFGGESEVPYLPLVAALRPLARSGDAELPEAVAPLLPGRSDAGAGGQPELFEGLLALLESLGRERPVLLVVEDLHWADRSTRAALSFLAHGLTDERALLAASYRTDELLRGHPLRALLADLAPRARRVALGPLTRDELAEQLTEILGDAPADDLLERLWLRSGGNPLFGEELLAAGLGRAPDTLRDALLLRVERLSEAAREPLGLIAVGQRLDHALLQETSGRDPAALRAALREAIDGHVVVADEDGAYRFRHALLREVVEDDLLPGERSELHLALARALERRLDDAAGAQVTAAVAHHFAAAGDRPAALAAAVRAAAATERVHAHGETAALLGRALELWARVPDAEALAGTDRVALLVRAADAAAALGDPGRQLALLELAFAALSPQPDTRRAARILDATARAQRHLNRAEDGIATFERALELVGDTPERAGLLAGLARARMLVGHHEQAIRAAHEALELTDEPEVEGHARNSLGCSLALTGAVDEGIAELRAAIRIARERDNLSDLAEVHVNYADALHIAGRSEEALAVVEEGRAAVAGRRPVALLWLDMKTAEVAFGAGDWELAEARLPAVQRWTGAQARAGALLWQAALALGRGQHADADALLRELEPLGAESSHPHLLAPLGVISAELQRRTGDLDAARTAIERALERCAGDAVAVAALGAAGVTIAADAAQRARDLDDGEAEAAALRRADDLIARVSAAATTAAGAERATGRHDGAARDIRADAPPARPVEHAALLSAHAEGARAAGRPDGAQYEHAAEAWDAVGRPEPAAVMRWRAAEAYVAADEREAAAKAARATRATAVRLGAGWLRGEVESLAARARLRLGSEPEQPTDEDAFGMTARERQVLELLAEGAMNREIGERLFMAEKTASVHVSRILAKLGARTRTEAATIAHRHGLT